MMCSSRSVLFNSLFTVHAVFDKRLYDGQLVGR